MTPIDCPRCGASGGGAFCPSCGAALQPPPCRACGAQPPPAARYCTACGRRLSGRFRVHPGVVAAGLGLALIAAAVLLPTPDGAPVSIGPAADPPVSTPGAPPGGSEPAGGGSGAPALSGDMRTNADGLFDRIMRELAAGDTARARFFVPMAVDAYRMAGDLDADGLFHLSLVHAIGGDHAAARRTAERILSGDPNHLLGLAAAASAAEGEGDAEAARAYHRRFLEALPAERDRPLPEYRDHARSLPEYEEAARAALEG